MVFKDILVNYSKTTKDRMAFVKDKLELLAKDERIIFIGNTFYSNDLNLSFFVEFIDLLNQYKNHSVYIQDVESLSAKLMNTQARSWYTLPLWPLHVQLYLTIDEISVTSTELRTAIKYSTMANKALSQDSEFGINTHTETSVSIVSNMDNDKNSINMAIKKPYRKKNKEEIDFIYQEHTNDLIGEFVNVVKSYEFNPEKEASILTIGIDALLGW